MLNIETVDALPPVRRGGGRQSEDKKKLVAAIESGKVNKIADVKAEREYNALQQRIRQAAQSAGLKVSIRFVKDEDGQTGDVFFQKIAEDEPEVVAESEVEDKPKRSARNSSK